VADVVVIGAGAAGLTAGALLARAGREVVVVDPHDAPGGHLRTGSRRGHQLDVAVHFLMAGGPGGRMRQILEVLEVDARLRAPETFVTASLPGLTLPIPVGREAFVAAHAVHWPGEVDGLVRLLDLCDRVLAQVRAFPEQPSLPDLVATLWRCPTLVRYRTATLARVLDQHLRDPLLKAAVATLWPYLGLPPGRLAFLLWAVMTGSYVGEGAHRCLGGSGSLAHALAVGLIRHGGRLRLGVRVEGIDVQGGRCAGVRLSDGSVVGARHVIATGDVRHMLALLEPGANVSPAVRRRVAREEVSAEAWALAVEVSDLGDAPLETHVHAGIDHDDAWARSARGELGHVIVTAPTRFDPSMSPPGRHQVVAKTVVPANAVLDPGHLEATLRAGASRVVPEVATARALGPVWRSGPAYGWASSIHNSGPARLAPRVGVPGLTLAGHWTQPGPGVSTAMESGVRAAGAILGSCPVLSNASGGGRVLRLQNDVSFR
jgi:prolycopene isomerase